MFFLKKTISMNEQNPLKPWMHLLLKFAGGYNIVAGASMFLFYHEGFKLLGIPKPEIALPIQLVGLLVGLFGIGYLMVERAPVENRNILLLGFLSKLLGPLLAVGYVIKGDLPVTMLPILFFADTIYLIPFWLIYRRTSRLAGQQEPGSSNANGQLNTDAGQGSKIASKRAA